MKNTKQEEAITKNEKFNLLKLTSSSSGKTWQQTGTQLNENLQKTLEIEKLMLTFAESIQQEVLLESLYFNYNPLNINLSLGKKSKHIIKFNLKLNKQKLGTLRLSTTRKLVKYEVSLLKYFLSKFIYPLQNSLRYKHAMQNSLEDHLTEIGNKRAMHMELDREIRYSSRHNNLFCLIIFDLDNFKIVNDELGHNVGDEVIQVFANCIRFCMRSSDAAFRYGGDEFILLLRNTDLKGAKILAKRLKEESKCRFSKFNHKLPKRNQLNVSLGISSFIHKDNYASLLQRADNELYAVKRKKKKFNASSLFKIPSKLATIRR